MKAVGTSEANDCPIMSSKEMENTKKFKMTATNSDSIGIDVIRIFLLLSRIRVFSSNICSMMLIYGALQMAKYMMNEHTVAIIPFLFYF
jgi:hypothetical protein